MTGFAAILAAAAPYASALANLIGLVSRYERKELTDEQLAAEIAKITATVNASEAADLALFAAAKAQRLGNPE